MRKPTVGELRATLAVAAVYGYFLIFAQFSFVELLRAGGVETAGEKGILGLMAVAGIAGGFVAAWRGVSTRLARMALMMAGLAAAVAPLTHGIESFTFIALLTGAALGVVTVCLAALLPAWCGVAWVGLGTGLAYALCNMPAVFLQSPAGQAWIAATFALTGVIALPNGNEWNRVNHKTVEILPFWGVVVIFTALVWMDSAAFFIIQHSGDLKSGTWGETLLWRNAVVHLALACAAGLWMARGWVKSLPVIAWILLAIAALMVNGASTRGVAGWMYPAGVSLYSAALVAWPGWFAGADGPRRAAWQAAWLFAIAGWFGSANGIGMAQSLEQVPPVFVALAGGVFGCAMVLADMKRWRILATVAAVGIAAWLFGDSGTNSNPPNFTSAERGRRVYLSEGCIHCHSQYIRPGSHDEEIWGPTRDVKNVLEAQPVLIGNRRQGPDLSNVGARRSAAWLKAHFIEPRTLVPKSPMPSYAHLFANSRGDDLVRYLAESGKERIENVRENASQWKPGSTAAHEDAKVLFSSYCAACHGASGLGNGPLARNFSKLPANLTKGPFLWTPAGEDLETRVARVIKFGVPGTDMPGHEVMTDAQIMALTDEVLLLRKNPMAK